MDELFNRVANDVGILLSTQIDVAKLELREEALRAGRAARLLSAGTSAAVLAVVMAACAVALAVGDALDAPALGFGVVAVAVALAAVVLLIDGRRRMRRGRLVSAPPVATEKTPQKVSPPAT